MLLNKCDLIVRSNRCHIREKAKKVYKKTDADWELKQRCESADKAEKAIRLLRAIEHGYKKERNKT